MSTLENDPPEAGSGTAAGAAAESRRGEHFIALRKADLGDVLARAGSLSADEAAAFGRFCRLLHLLVHGELQPGLEELKDAYAPFNPDRATVTLNDLDEAQLDALRGRLFERFGWLLERGNFKRLAERQINAAVGNRSHWGLHLTVDFELFDRLEVYYRGDTTGTRYRRRLRTGFRLEELQVPIYQRLVVIFRLRPGRRFSRILDTRDVYLKLFKEIPKPDLDMLLPETKVKMTLFDRLRVALPTLSGLGIAIYKIVWATTVALGMSLGFLLLIGGTLGYGVRSLYGYLNTKQKYQLSLTQSLYYQNIDNNAGVIHRLLDEAEEQENREVMLAYFFLWREAPSEGWTASQLDCRVERFLHEHAELAVDFEIADALDKLRRFGLAECRGERWTAPGIEPALRALADYWTALPEQLG